jgi:hypothetical protein
MAAVNAALMKQILNIPQRKREPDIYHNGKTNDLGRSLKSENALRRHPINKTHRITITRF